MASRTRAWIFSSRALTFRSRASAIRSVSRRRSMAMHSSTACLSSTLLRKLAATTSQSASGRFSPLIWARSFAGDALPARAGKLEGLAADGAHHRLAADGRLIVHAVPAAVVAFEHHELGARCMSPRSFHVTAKWRGIRLRRSTRTLLSGRRSTWRDVHTYTCPRYTYPQGAAHPRPRRAWATTNKRRSPASALSSAATERPRDTSSVTIVLGKASSPRRGRSGNCAAAVCFFTGLTHTARPLRLILLLYRYTVKNQERTAMCFLARLCKAVEMGNGGRPGSAISIYFHFFPILANRGGFLYNSHSCLLQPFLLCCVYGWHDSRRGRNGLSALGATHRRQRKLMGLTQKEVAERAGISLAVLRPHREGHAQGQPE